MTRSSSSLTRNGAYSRKQASRLGRHFMAEADVSWFEEPVSSDDLEGLKEVKEQLVLDVTAGEYGGPRNVLRTHAGQWLRGLPADRRHPSRGFTSRLRGADLALAAWGVEVSAHCAPNLHAHIGAAVPHLRHVEYFHDHQKVDSILFEGALDPTGGILTLTATAPGMDSRQRNRRSDLPAIVGAESTHRPFEKCHWQLHRGRTPCAALLGPIHVQVIDKSRNLENSPGLPATAH